MHLSIPDKILLVIVVSALVALGGVTLYSGIWPPTTVVESESMQHSQTWTAGTINTGDMVMIKHVPSPKSDVITYVQGRSSGFSTYGDYGNVIIYQAPSGPSIIHRALLYLTWTNGLPHVAGYSNQPWITVTSSYILVKDVGYSHRNMVVKLGGFAGENGFITFGDHNLATSASFNSVLDAYVAADQNLGIAPGPISPSEVVGVAYGEIPWFGLIKLNVMGLFGEWPTSNEVPQYSYLYLFLSIVGIVAALATPYYVFPTGSRK